MGRGGGSGIVQGRLQIHWSYSIIIIIVHSLGFTSVIVIQVPKNYIRHNVHYIRLPYYSIVYPLFCMLERGVGLDLRLKVI